MLLTIWLSVHSTFRWQKVLWTVTGLTSISLFQSSPFVLFQHIQWTFGQFSQSKINVHHMYNVNVDVKELRKWDLNLKHQYIILHVDVYALTGSVNKYGMSISSDTLQHGRLFLWAKSIKAVNCSTMYHRHLYPDLAEHIIGGTNACEREKKRECVYVYIMHALCLCAGVRTHAHLYMYLNPLELIVLFIVQESSQLNKKHYQQPKG